MGEATVARLLTLFVVLYVAWMLSGRRMMWWGSKEDVHYIPPNGKWVYHDEEPGLFWVAVVFHAFIILAMGYVSFFR